MALETSLIAKILVFQQTEITEHQVYKFLSEKTKGKNSKILLRISQEELRHYNLWKKFTNKDMPLPAKQLLVVSTANGDCLYPKPRLFRPAACLCMTTMKRY